VICRLYFGVCVRDKSCSGCLELRYYSKYWVIVGVTLQQYKFIALGFVVYIGQKTMITTGGFWNTWSYHWLTLKGSLQALLLALL